jgi:hypothetical protein
MYDEVTGTIPALANLYAENTCSLNSVEIHPA